jgi:hypothetical protein
MALSPHGVRVCGIDGDRVSVQLVGEVADRHQALGGGTLVVRWVDAKHDEVQVTVRMAA